MTKERWKEIPGYEGRYQVSDHGHIRSLLHNKRSGKFLRQRLNGGGYAIVIISNRRRRETKYVHRVVVETFIGPIAVNLEVNHKDGNKQNNHLGNLQVVTPSENQKHAYRNGLNKAHAKPVLQLDSDGRELARFPDAGTAQAALGIERSSICNACNGKLHTAGGFRWRYAG